MKKIRKVFAHCVILFLLILLVNFEARSQYSVPRDRVAFHQSMDLGIAGGLNTYFGEVSFNENRIGGGFAVYCRYNFWKWMSVRLDVGYIGLSSYDDYWGRAFNTDALHINARFDVNLLSGVYPDKSKLGGLYIFFGVGTMHSIGVYSEYKSMDRENITSKEDYSNLGLDLTFGVGFKYKLSPKFLIGFEIMSHAVIPDNFDNVLSKDIQGSKTKFDLIPYAGITLGYNLTFKKGLYNQLRSRVY